MAREISFPRSRHVALSAAEQIDDAQAKALGIEALLWPGASAEEAAAPPVRLLPRVVVVDISLHASDADRCVALDGSPAPVRCPSSLEGRQAAGDAAARAAQPGEAVLLSGLDRWYRMGPEGAGYCRS